MAPFVAAAGRLPRLHPARTTGWRAWSRPTSGDGLAADFYREIAAFLPEPDREPGAGGAARHRARGLRRPRGAGGASRPTRRVAGRLALWARRLVGEAISQSQAVIAEHDALAELIIAGTGDLAGVGALIKRLTSAHTERMRRPRPQQRSGPAYLRPQDGAMSSGAPSRARAGEALVPDDPRTPRRPRDVPMHAARSGTAAVSAEADRSPPRRESASAIST